MTERVVVTCPRAPNGEHGLRVWRVLPGETDEQAIQAARVCLMAEPGVTGPDELYPRSFRILEVPDGMTIQQFFDQYLVSQCKALDRARGPRRPN